jgi:hypothetical protein
MFEVSTGDLRYGQPHTTEARFRDHNYDEQLFPHPQRPN